MKRRMIAVLCIAAMLASLLAGCGEKETPEIKTPEISDITPGIGTQLPDNSTTDSSNQSSQKSAPCVTVNAYADHWSDVRIWAWSESQGDLFAAWPGDSMTDDGNGWYSYEVPTWVDHVIINGNGGAEQTADIPVKSYESWIMVYTDNAASITYKDPAYISDPWDGCEIIGGQWDGGAYDAAVQPAQSDYGYTAELNGWWEQVHIQDGNLTLNVSALCFGETVYNCTGLTVNMDVTMNAGTSCKDWQLWGRSGNTFTKLAKVNLPAGDGYTSQSITFDRPVTFDALVLAPTIPGGYSFTISMTITDVYAD